MASQQQRQEAGYKADDEMSSGGHTQMNRQNASITSQATNFLQQTGEQVKNMAHGAAEAVKSSLGMTADNSASPNPSAGSSGNKQGSGPTASTGNNPGGAGPTASAGNHPGGASFGSGGNNPRDVSVASGGNLLSPNQTASAGSHRSNPSQARS
ncbi:hypothetical protein SLEP1_g44024 [Rubroshorea leprosula]|uniref:Uncharacterized protein n=1 Tax=Rubroshorea leprosula TaxID=152421 RepID=A0AAV5LFT5_9ROSI|nr:hypothetical protein SLEP1_g44024 [Rubroshorea leprosula]